VIHPIHCEHHIIFYEVTLYSNENIYGVTHKYRGVSFCDGSFYNDSLLQPLSSRIEHPRLVVHHCRNSGVLSLLSVLLALFRCASVFFSTLVQLYWVECDFSIHDFHQKRQKRRKNQNSWRYILSWCLLNHGLGLPQQNKKCFHWYFSIICEISHQIKMVCHNVKKYCKL